MTACMETFSISWQSFPSSLPRYRNNVLMIRTQQQSDGGRVWLCIRRTVNACQGIPFIRHGDIAPAFLICPVPAGGLSTTASSRLLAAAAQPTLQLWHMAVTVNSLARYHAVLAQRTFLSDGTSDRCMILPHNKISEREVYGANASRFYESLAFLPSLPTAFVYSPCIVSSCDIAFYDVSTFIFVCCVEPY